MKACELSGWNDANDIDTPAAAAAEVEDWDNAAKQQEQSIEMLSNEADKEKARVRLELDKATTPYQEEL